MGVPASIADLSTTAGSNSPLGSDTITDAAGPDDYLRAHAAIIKTHTEATAEHGATGAVVGTTNTQTLTNKTLTAPVINGVVTTTGLTLPAATVGALNGTTIPTSKTLLTTDSVLDEDDMVSNSATAVPSQQSVKAYADIAASTTVAGKVELATAAETQAVTDTTRAVTPVSLASLLPVAWVSFDGTTNTAGNCTIGADYNVSTVTDNGTGDYTINFSNALTDAHYAIAGWSYGDGVIISGNGSNAPTSSACRIRNRGHEGSYVDSAKITVIFFR